MDQSSQHIGEIMENKTGFDLNGAIAEWRGGMRREDALGAEVLRELESHLRESVRDLAARGLSEEEAFLIARRRIGAAPEVGREFAAANPDELWRRRLLWSVLCVVFFWLFSEFFVVVAQLLNISGLVLRRPIADFTWLSVLAAVSAWWVARGIAHGKALLRWRRSGRSRRNAGFSVACGILAMKTFNVLIFPMLFWLAGMFTGQGGVSGEPAPAGVIAAYVTRQCLWVLLAGAVGLFVMKFAAAEKAASD
jgi:hypothetical protein